MAATPMHADVRNFSARGAVESVQSNLGGAIFADTAAGGPFLPHSPATRLIAAIAFVRAAGLESQTATASLPSNLADAASPMPPVTGPDPAGLG